MAAPVKKTVELFYDVVSPYSWIAFEVLCRYKTKWDIDVKLKPFFLGGMMQGSDNKPPGMVPAKARYLTSDVERLAKHFNIPYNHPKNPAEVMFVKGTLTTQRFLTAIDMSHPEYVEEVSRELWKRAYSRDEDISEPDSLAQVGRTLGMQEAVIQDAIKRLKDPAVKDRLKKYTQEALELGGFGSPMLVTKDSNNQTQWVFGSDRFHILADILGKKYEGPLCELAKL